MRVFDWLEGQTWEIRGLIIIIIIGNASSEAELILHDEAFLID